VFSALEVCYENALYKFTFDVDIDIDIDILGQMFKGTKTNKILSCSNIKVVAGKAKEAA